MRENGESGRLDGWTDGQNEHESRMLGLSGTGVCGQLDQGFKFPHSVRLKFQPFKYQG